MVRIPDCRDNALRCRAMAEAATDTQTHVSLLDMAQEWTLIAAALERLSKTNVLDANTSNMQRH
jgi:hypothetical protein